jgi:hypothetical protein
MLVHAGVGKPHTLVGECPAGRVFVSAPCLRPAFTTSIRPVVVTRTSSCSREADSIRTTPTMEGRRIQRSGGT